MNEQAANEQKKRVDELAASLLQIDERSIVEAAEAVANVLSTYSDTPLHIVVCGGAGSNKTTFSAALSKELSAPAFDLDTFIPGGFTEDKWEYSNRFKKGLEKLWDEIPPVMPWIVEHVEACNRDVVDLLHPTFAILLNPGMEHLKTVARARDAVGEDTEGKRKRRALETGIRSRLQFQSLRGKTILRREGIEVKTLPEG